MDHFISKIAPLVPNTHTHTHTTTSTSTRPPLVPWSDTEEKAVLAFVKDRTGSEFSSIGKLNPAWNDIERKWEGFGTTRKAYELGRKYIRLRQKVSRTGRRDWSDAEEKVLLGFVKDRMGNEFGSIGKLSLAWNDLEREWPGKGFGATRTAASLIQRYCTLRQERAPKHPAAPQQPSTTTSTYTTTTAPTAPPLPSQNIFDFALTGIEIQNFSTPPPQPALQLGGSGRTAAPRPTTNPSSHELFGCKRPHSAVTSPLSTSTSSKKVRVVASLPASAPPTELPNILNYAHFTYVQLAPLRHGQRRGLL